MTSTPQHAALLRRGRRLEGATLGWNVVGIVVLGMAAVSARSVALAGFGLDSLHLNHIYPAHPTSASTPRTR